jgi:hypothetical protein
MYFMKSLGLSASGGQITALSDYENQQQGLYSTPARAAFPVIHEVIG